MKTRTERPTATYAKWDGDDWVVQPPGRTTGVTLDVYVLRADLDALRHNICKAMINDPTGGAVTVSPLLPAAFLFRVQIEKGWSVGHEEQGWQPENDVGFFVPVRLNERPEFAALVPYIFVDNWVGLISGRELFGFPKQLGDFDETADRLTVEAIVAPDRPGDQAIAQMVFGIPDLGKAAARQLDGNVVLHILEMVLEHLGAANLSSEILPNADPMSFRLKYLFLKQFRDAAEPGKACYQAVVRAPVDVQIHKVAVVTSPIKIDLPPRASLQMAQTLGLKDTESTLALRVKAEMAIPPGEVLWTA